MKIQRGEEVLTHPCKSWTDENGKTWEWPTLAFMQKHGFTEYIKPPLTPEEVEQEIKQTAINELVMSDASTIRILEDLVDLLCQKNHINYYELPVAAQEKLNYRKEQRMIVAASDGVTAEEETTYQSNSLWATIKSWFGF